MNVPNLETKWHTKMGECFALPSLPYEQRAAVEDSALSDLLSIEEEILVAGGGIPDAMVQIEVALNRRRPGVDDEAWSFVQAALGNLKHGCTLH